ncbi:hypothetical protein [Lactococcus lactis]|uniref:hypothetical protein n=1 Tax=Lactococcus lactis TaxID=1358 RepID=UPI00223BA3FB|nr:hypothetical protein [Lactococcus lactis]
MFTYEGKQYKTYYQLAKVMGIDRSTIRHRHEKLGIPIDEIKNYVPEPKTMRFSFKEKSDRSEKTSNIVKVNELDIINYPKFPEIPYSLGIDEQSQLKQDLMDWSKKCPNLLLKRAIHLLEEDYKQLVNLIEEQGQYAYGRENNESKKEFYHDILVVMRDFENKNSEGEK